MLFVRMKMMENTCYEKYKNQKNSGPDEIRTHDLPVISRAHHLAMLRAPFYLTIWDVAV